MVWIMGCDREQSAIMYMMRYCWSKKFNFVAAAKKIVTE